MAETEKTKEPGSGQATTRVPVAPQAPAGSQVQGAESENAYGGSNTKDYSDSITAQYNQFVQEQNEKTEAAVQNATDRLNQIQAAGDRAAEVSADLARQDSNEIRQTRKAMERNEGNRQGIGESQYGVAENAYDQQMAVIEGVKQKLRTDVARQVSDLRAKGDFAQANAMLETAQAQFRQLYEEGLRVGGNLRGNYEYQTQLQREDAAIQREQDNADLDWKRTMGEFMLKHGVTPSEDLLSALGIDSSAANLYINAVTGGYYGSGGGGGGSGSGSTPDIKSIQDEYWGDDGNPPFIADDDDDDSDSYNSAIADNAISMAQRGDINGAWTYLTQNAAYLTEEQYGALLDTTLDKYYTHLGNYYTGSYYDRYAGGGATNNWGIGNTGGGSGSGSGNGGSTTPTGSGGTNLGDYYTGSYYDRYAGGGAANNWGMGPSGSTIPSSSGSGTGGTSTVVKPSTKKPTGGATTK